MPKSIEFKVSDWIMTMALPCTCIDIATSSYRVIVHLIWTFVTLGPQLTDSTTITDLRCYLISSL